MGNDRYNISAIQGSTLLLNLNVKNSDGTYMNLSGYTVRSFVREQYSSTGVLLNLNPNIHSSMISGLVLISGTATGMANLKVGEYVYDVELSGASEYVIKPIVGYFQVGPETTY